MKQVSPSSATNTLLNQKELDVIRAAENSRFLYVRFSEFL